MSMKKPRSDEELPINEDNPYAPPIADLIIIDKSGGTDRLADRFTRFTAAILDSIIGLAFGVPAMFLMGIWTYPSDHVSVTDPGRGIVDVADRCYLYLSSRPPLPP